MRFYAEGVAVSVTVPFTDEAGQAILPTAISAVLIDGWGTELLDMPVIVFSQPAGEVAILVAATYNQLLDGELRAVRHLKVTLTTADAVVRKEFSYAFGEVQPVVVLKNSFMTYGAAEVLSADMANITGWAAASESQRRTAMVDAFRRVARIPLQFFVRDAEGVLDEEHPVVIPPDTWITMTSDTYLALPISFRMTLCRAQLVEADAILAGDVLTKKMRAGIVSETIGESSIRLQGNKVDHGLSTAALQVLAGHIAYSNRIARA